MFQLPDRKFRDFKAAMADGVVLTRVIPESVCAAGFFTVDTNGEDIEICPNYVVATGRSELLACALANRGSVYPWFVALGDAAVAPTATWTATDFVSTTGNEFVSYAGNRPNYTPDAVGATDTSITNSASKAAFTINAAGPFTLDYAGIIDLSTKGGFATDVLMAAAAFSSPRSVDNTDVVNIQYTLSLTSP